MSSSISPDSLRTEYPGGIPLLNSYFERLQIRQTIDDVIPSAPQAGVSHGECVIALILSLFMDEHRLYKVDESLE